MTEFPLEVGDVASVAMLSPCVGGLVRTWTENESRLWSVPESTSLPDMQGVGVIGRALREERRFREVGMLVADSGLLMLNSRFPKSVVPEGNSDHVQIGGRMVALEPAREAAGSVSDDLYALLAKAIRHVIVSDEFLVVEKGGWDAPNEPYCLFAASATDDNVMIVLETAPAPTGSDLWASRIQPGKHSANMLAPWSREAVDSAPAVMLDAIGTWGLQPWDLALTFGRR